ncbi:MAG: cupin domain-containing protein [Phycisphaerae bacterium]
MSTESVDALKGKALTLVDLVDYREGSVVSRVVLKQKAGNVSLLAFDAGQELSEHTAPFDAMATVLEGDAEITLAATPIHATAGQTVIMPANVPHAVRAVGRFKMMLTMIKG